MSRTMSKKRGRPVGSKNRLYTIVMEVPPGCPACGSVDLSVVNGSPPRYMEHAGQLPDGREYSRVKWVRKVCSCGQYLEIRSYLTDADTSKEK